MDKQTKRRVLSLSLSQPGKQHKKLRLRRHASNTLDIDPKSVDSKDDQQSSILRDDSTGDVPQSCPVVSKSLQVEINDHSASWETLVPQSSSSILPSAVNRQSRKHRESDERSKDTQYVETVSPTKQSLTDRNDDKELCTNGRGEKNVSKGCSRPPISSKSGSEGKKKNLDSDAVMITFNRADSDSSSNFNAKPMQTIASEEKTCVSNVKSSVETISSLSLDSSVPDTKTMSHSNSISKDEFIEVLQCPLCFKNFDKSTTKTSHMKSCASKHKLSTQQLLDALDLQQRQAAERRVLGLPEIPQAAGNGKKTVIPKKETRATSKVDSNLQLAMALSLSLQDQEQAAVARGVSLDHFGFTSKSVLEAVQPRPASPASRGKTKKASALSRPPLLTRTAEERQRIITEKVAMVLLEGVSGKNESLHEVQLQSTYLQDCLQTENLLWGKSFTSPAKSDRASYYVKDLRGFISPSKVDAGSKVMHLSQVAGRVKTPPKKEKQQHGRSVQTSSSDEGNSSDSNSGHQNSKAPAIVEMELRAKLFNDWAVMVNNATMSDLTVYPQEGREIPGHKIILHVRCPRILRDISRQRNPLTGNEVEVIMWSKTPHVAALAFLEYVYCGSVKSLRALCEDLSSILWLANHYKITDLLRYLDALTASIRASETSSQVALNVVKDFNEDSFVPHDVEIIRGDYINSEKKRANCTNSPPIVKEDMKPCLQKPHRASVDMFSSPVLTPSRSETESIYSEITVAGGRNRSSCSSPDIFDEDVPESPTVDVEREKDQSCPDAVRRDDGNKERPHSQCHSISSETTIVVGKKSPAHSQCASVSSEKTDIVEKRSEPPSPSCSSSSAATEVLDCNEEVSKQNSVLLNDSSKRRHSSGSEDNGTSACKRSRSAQTEKPDSDVECLDLTQDSDSNTSHPAVSNNLSEESCDKILILSDNEISDADNKSEKTSNFSQSSSQTNLKTVSLSNDQQNCEVNNLNAGNEQVVDLDRNSNQSNEAQPYVSPVWDGFEDINYDDPFLYSEHPGSSYSPTKAIVSPKSASRNSILSSASVSPSAETKSTPEKRSTNCSDNGKIRAESGNSSDCEVAFHSPNVLPKKTQPSTSSGFDALWDDTLNISDTVLQQAESGVKSKLTQRETKGTPVNRILSYDQDRVTPLLDFSAMKTPELKRELQKYGLKPTLGKRKGKIMLRHIYNELHPWVNVDSEESLPKKVTLSQPSSSRTAEREVFSCSQPNSRKLTFSESDDLEEDAQNCGTSESDSDSNDSRCGINTSRQEIQYLEGDCDEAEALQASQPVSKGDLPEVVSDFIVNDRDLHQKVLEYKPIVIEELHRGLRSRGFKFKSADLMAFLDEKCITFRTTQGGSRIKKRKLKCASSKRKAAADNTTSSDITEHSN